MSEDNKQRSRLTIVSKVYHNVPGQNTVGPEPVSFYRYLTTDEQAYSRTVKVGKEWQEIDIGWLKDIGCSYIQLINDTKRLPSKVPTKEVSDNIASRAIELGIEVKTQDGREVGIELIIPICSFSPEEGTGLSPSDVSQLRVRCINGEARLTYFVVPK